MDQLSLYTILETVVVYMIKTGTGAFLVTPWGGAKDFKLEE